MKIDTAKYWNDGYLKIPGVFSKEEVANLRAKAIATAGTGGDLLSQPELSEFVLDRRLVDAAGELLDGDPLYFGFSSANHAVTTATGSWHRDCADRLDFSAPDWRSRYTLLRFGLYLQDHKRHSGGLNVRPTSHEAETAKTDKVAYVDSAVGDLVVWNLRTLHSGDGQRMRFPWWKDVDPKKFERVPTWNVMPKHDTRIALFATYAVESTHLDYYIDYLKTRDFMLRMWNTSTMTDDVCDQAAASGLKLRNVRDELAD